MRAENTPASPIVVAHRGASGFAPENTLAAIEAAIRQGADFVEVDVQLTADGEAVLLHDPLLSRTTNAEQVLAGRTDRPDLRVDRFTLEELRGLDAGSWFAPEFAGERIPTLRQALEVMRGRIGMWLELKSPHLHPGLEKKTAEVLRSTPGGWLDTPGTCVATCFHADALQRFAVEVDRAVPFGQLAETVPDDATLREMAGYATYYIPDGRQVLPGDLTRIRAAGLDPVFWTPNDPLMIAGLLAQGAEALIGNYPGLIREVAEGRYRVPHDGMVIEKLVGSEAHLRNLDPAAALLEGWYLRGDPADRLWTGDGAVIPAREAYVVELPAQTDSAALHRPDGTLADVAGRIS